MRLGGVLLSWVLLAGCALFAPAIRTDALGIVMVRVKGGSFTMGDAFEGTNTDALPLHRVQVRTFYLSRYETTFDQYDAFARATGRPLPEDDGFGRGGRAVTGVSWDEAVAFCTAYGYRLPTEAEWEYAARERGQHRLFPGTNDSTALAAFGVFEGQNIHHSMPVGQKRPNALGLYDLAGNVSEWVGAFYERYPAPGTMPVFKELTRPGLRILRGGSFLASNAPPTPGMLMRTYWRTGALNDSRSPSIGFRCAR